MDILETEKPKTIKLADDKEYTLPPIDLTTLANIEKTIGFSLAKIGLKMEAEAITTLRSLVYALLKENHPELTLEDTGHLITLKEISSISPIISEMIALS